MSSSASLAPAHPEPQVSDPRRLLVAWQNPDTRRIALVGVLERGAGRYCFRYLRAALDTPGFRPFLGFDDLRRRYESEQLFPLFRQRIMDHDRPDFDRYLDTLGLGENSSPLAVLGRSGGKRAGDSIFLLREPEVFSDGITRAMFFVHGVRYQQGAAARIGQLRPGDQLHLRPEPDNEFNARAVLVTIYDDQAIGWVPDLLTDYVQHALSMGTPAVRVSKVNGEDTPPNLRLLVELSGQLPIGYRPFDPLADQDLA
ncbi:MAG: HIRAN domain-containing protein [Pseudonocardiaceae bacterium]